jgi:cytochrome c peroxidase
LADHLLVPTHSPAEGNQTWTLNHAAVTRNDSLVNHFRDAWQKQLVELDVPRKIAQSLQDFDDRVRTLAFETFPVGSKNSPLRKNS